MSISVPLDKEVRLNEKIKDVAGLFQWVSNWAKGFNDAQCYPASPGKRLQYHVSENVQHDRFGAGRVIARWPDGSLLVKFEQEVGNRLVWPSLLARGSG
jgi:hypothetical protein